jgi:hypothetical protein
MEQVILLIKIRYYYIKDKIINKMNKLEKISLFLIINYLLIINYDILLSDFYNVFIIYPEFSILKKRINTFKVYYEYFKNSNKEFIPLFYNEIHNSNIHKMKLLEKFYNFYKIKRAFILNLKSDDCDLDIYSTSSKKILRLFYIINNESTNCFLLLNNDKYNFLDNENIYLFEPSKFHNIVNINNLCILVLDIIKPCYIKIIDNDKPNNIDKLSFN